MNMSLSYSKSNAPTKMQRFPFSFQLDPPRGTADLTPQVVTQCLPITRHDSLILIDTANDTTRHHTMDPVMLYIYVIM